LRTLLWKLSFSAWVRSNFENKTLGFGVKTDDSNVSLPIDLKQVILVGSTSPADFNIWVTKG
jgi:hypothetical protein